MRHLGALPFIAALIVTASAAGYANAAVPAATCTWPALSQPFAAFNDSNSYFLAPGGNFQDTSGWSLSGGAAAVSGGAGFDGTDTSSLALPTTAAAATTPTICVTSQSPTFRMCIKNDGNLGRVDGQLAVYLNYTEADGRVQQVKIAALTVKSASWTLTDPISFIQYISKPLQSGYAKVSFTVKPTANRGSWQIDDIYVDPWNPGLAAHTELSRRRSRSLLGG